MFSGHILMLKDSSAMFFVYVSFSTFSKNFADPCKTFSENRRKTMSYTFVVQIVITL